jgi:lipopolysaccharide transport system ATP-binding protein
MTESAVIFKNVTKTYPSYQHITAGFKSMLFNLPSAISEFRNRQTALEDISFTIPKGSKFGFIGRNGAGKSTTLGLIAGVLVPDAGTVTVNGRVSPLLELGAGFHPELSGYENIILNGVLLGLSKQEVLEKVEEVIEFSELGRFIDQPVRTYSSGMYAKLGFSVVSILKPEILLLDEILSVGDEAFSRKCQKKFEEFRTDPDITLILVSHSLESVRKICDTVAWVENKKIKMIGDTNEVVQSYLDAMLGKTESHQ